MYRRLSIMKKLILIFFLLFSGVSYAADNPTLVGYPQNKIMGFRGLDTRSNPPNLDDGRAIDLLNVELSSAFDLKKRNGYSVVEASLDDWDISSPSINGIFYAEYSDGSKTYAFAGDRLKYVSTDTWLTVSASATPTITDGQNYQWQCTMALDKAVCVNDQDSPMTVSSSPQKDFIAFGLGTNPTKARAVIWYRNYLIFGNTYEGAQKSTRFRWSNVGTIDTFSEEDYVDISSLSGDEIMGFSELYGELYIVMRKSIWKATLVGGDDVFVFTKMIDGIGAVSPESIKVLTFPDNKLGIAFLSEDRKVYLFNGVTVIDIGNIIQSTLNGLSESRLHYSVAVSDSSHYYLSSTLSGYSSNNIVLIYNTEINEWTKYDNINANSFGKVIDSSLVKIYFGNYDGFVYWISNPDNNNDVDGATGIIDSTGVSIFGTQTGATIFIDTGLVTGTYTGATITITSGTDVGSEYVIVGQTSTGVVISTTPTTNPDSTSNYSIGNINAYYETKWYDFGQSQRLKTFLGVYFWAAEQSSSQITVDWYTDFGSIEGSTNIDLAPTSTSLWDSAVWDESVWGTTGDKFYTAKLKGNGRFLKLKFSDDTIDSPFHLYGFHLLGDMLDVE